MNKYNVKAIRRQLDNFVAFRNWSAFRKRFVSLLPSYIVEEVKQKPPNDETDQDMTTYETFPSDDVSACDRQKLELCRAVVELTKCTGHRTDWTDRCPSLLHDLCLKFYSKMMVSSRHRYPPVPIDILEMVAQISSRKIFLAPYGKRRQTPLALLLDQCPPAYVMERILTIMTRLEENESMSERFQVLYVQDASGDTPLLQAVKRFPDQDDVIKILIDFDSETLQSLLCGNKTGMIPLYYLFHRELKYLDQVEQISGQTSVSECNLQHQEISPNLLHLLLKTQKAILLDQELLPSPTTMVWNENGEDDGRIAVECSWDNCNDMEAWNSNSLASDNVRALRAIICCAHRLSNWVDLSKLIGILLTNLHIDKNLDAIDKNGNTFLHLTCMARATDLFVANVCPLLPFLLSNLPTALLIRNNQGKVPLHLALEYCSEWKLIHSLVVAWPEAARIPFPSNEHRKKPFPLHMIVSKREDTFSCTVQANIDIPSEDQTISFLLDPSVSSRNDSFLYKVEATIKIWKAFPEAALMMDPSTGLLPFQLAAICDTSIDKPCKNNKG
jgi:hypothetical protein